MPSLAELLAAAKATQATVRQRFDQGLPLIDTSAPPAEAAEAPAAAAQAKPVKPPPPTAGESVGLKPADVIFRVKLKHVTFNEAGIKRAIDQLVYLPEPGESFHFIMTGDFHGFDLVPAIQRLAGAPIDSLHLSTLGFSQRNNQQLMELYDKGHVANVAVVCGQMFVGLDPRIYAQAKARMDARGLRLRVARNHTKIMLFAIGAARYVVEASANLRSCNSFENVALIHSEELYEGHKKWLEHILGTVPPPEAPTIDEGPEPDAVEIPDA